MKRRSFVAGVSLAVLVPALGPACTKSPGFDPLPKGAVNFSPPSSYLTWWQQMESCSGITGGFFVIKWYKVPGESFPFTNGQLVYAQWSLPNRSITIASAHLNDSLIVRHEELHQLLGVHGHPSEYFVTKCGSLLGDFVD